MQLVKEIKDKGLATYSDITVAPWKPHEPIR
jgi:hypothetical protein